MARKRKHDGGIYRRPDSAVWWMWYRDREGRRQLESTSTEDWNEAQQRLRERLQARDQNMLLVVRKGEQLAFQDWRSFFWRIIPGRHFELRKRIQRIGERSSTWPPRLEHAS